VAVLVPGRPHGEYVLFCRDRDPERETWDGGAPGRKARCAIGADDAFPIGDIDDILPGLLEHRERVYYTMGLNAEFDQRLLGWVNQLRAAAKTGVHTPHRVRRARPPAARHAPVQEPGEIAADAQGARSPRRARARDARLPPGHDGSTRSRPNSCTSSAATPRRPPTSRSSAAAPTAASCTTSRTTRRSRTATCC
jgi:hypothetical protein